MILWKNEVENDKKISNGGRDYMREFVKINLKNIFMTTHFLGHAGVEKKKSELNDERKCFD